ncbi:hypothetical protein SDC9_45849 [bioreactor metagenome]|uniref:Uncharacterized protein n=1 Tax=bioreactor metagenome TaxID=1076179 RepID=A0A644W7C0_9ZZZZ
MIFVAGIIITSAAGVWSTESTKTPAKLKDTQYSEAYDPSDIRGSYTFSEISKLYSIPLEDLSAAFGVDEEKGSDFKCKDLESIYGASQYEIGTASVRMFTAYYLGLPYNPAEETYLPDAAAKILSDKGNMTQDQRDYLEKHAVPAA